MEKQKTINVRWLYLFIGILAMLFAGVIYAWSILKAPLTEHFGWNASQLSLNFTITMICFCLGGVLGGILAKKIGTVPTIIMGAVLVSTGFILSSTLSGQGIWLLYLFYGILGGLGIGIPYNTVLSTVNAWFPDKKGTSMGLMLMAFGASTLVIGKIADSFFQSPGIGWRKTYLILGISIGVILIITGLIIRRPSDNVTLPEAKTRGKKGMGTTIASRDYSTLEMIKRPSFWMAFVSILFAAAVGNSVISFAKDLSLSVGSNAALATLLTGLLAVCNGLGRIVFGALYDLIGCRKGMLISSAVTIAAAGVSLISVIGHSLPVCVAGLCLMGLSYGSCPTTVTTFTSEFFGMKHFATNFSVLNFNLIGTAFVASLSNVLFENSGGYVITFLFLLGLAAASFIINIFIKRP